jgi:hypothetical protein
MNADEIIIDPEFEKLLPYTDATEDALLEQSIIETEGPTDPLTLWGDSNILIDGHRRLKICKKHDLPFRTVREYLESSEDVRIWMLLKQLSRRNLQDKQRPRLVRELYDRIRINSMRGDGNAAEQVADMIGTTRRSIYRYVAKQRVIDSLIPGWQVQAERHGLNEETARLVAKCSKNDQELLLDACIGEQSWICKPSEIDMRVKAMLDMPKSKPKPAKPLPFGTELPGEVSETVGKPEGKKATQRELASKIAEAQSVCKELKRIVDELTSSRYIDSGILRQRMLTSVSRVAQCLKFMTDHAHERSGNR